MDLIERLSAKTIANIFKKRQISLNDETRVLSYKTRCNKLERLSYFQFV
jgi:hypothetical protein